MARVLLLLLLHHLWPDPADGRDRQPAEGYSRRAERYTKMGAELGGVDAAAIRSVPHCP